MMKRWAILLCAVLMWSSVAAERASGGQRADGEPKRSYGSIDVILYQTGWCPHCRKAKEYLKSMGVSLTEYDIEKDPAKGKEMISKSASQGVPVVDIEGIIIRGNDQDAIRSAIERKRRE